MTHLPFGQYLAQRVEEYGPLCVGIDPHPFLLSRFGLEDSPSGIKEFSFRIFDALGDHVACFKPQSAFFERFGAASLSVLESLAAEAKSAGIPMIMDVKRGDIGSTMAAYADSYINGPLAGDAWTVSPYLGPASLDETARRAIEAGKGFFTLCLTSNPEGARIQHARNNGVSVASDVFNHVEKWNRQEGNFPGSFGVVIGATVSTPLEELGIDPQAFSGFILAPGVGAQGAGKEEIEKLFGASRKRVLASCSRSVLNKGIEQSQLRQAVQIELDKVI